MNSYNAVGIAEGWIEAESEAQWIDAWQTLIDSGQAYQLQGWFGRTASQLIEEGVCLPPNNSRLVKAATALNKLEFIVV